MPTSTIKVLGGTPQKDVGNFVLTDGNERWGDFVDLSLCDRLCKTTLARMICCKRDHPHGKHVKPILHVSSLDVLNDYWPQLLALGAMSELTVFIRQS